MLARLLVGVTGLSMDAGTADALLRAAGLGCLSFSHWRCDFFGTDSYLYISEAYGITLIEPIAALTIEVVATVLSLSANGSDEDEISLKRSCASG